MVGYDNTLKCFFFLSFKPFARQAFVVWYLSSIGVEIIFIINFKTSFSKQIPFGPELLAPGQRLPTP